MDAIVVGAGLFGQVITKHLRSLGVEVTMIDFKGANSGSRPSASLMKPSWFSSLGAKHTDPALELLDKHYGVEELNFKIGPTKWGGVKWCNPRLIMAPPSKRLHIQRVGRGYVDSHVSQGVVDRLEASLIIVAAGVWTSSLLPVPYLQGKMGVSCLFPDRQIDTPFIIPWAPYKQLVAFNLLKDVWVGDGSAIKPANWTPERQAKTVNRCVRAVELNVARTELVQLVGNRPYVPKKYLNGRPCYLEEREPGLWIATGGAKNGTIAAGWCAHAIGEAIK